MILYEVLKLLNRADEMPDKILNHDDNILPVGSVKIRLCFMCEEETWIETYPSHPVLIPLYNYPVLNIRPTDENVLEIWIDYMKWYEERSYKIER